MQDFHDALHAAGIQFPTLLSSVQAGVVRLYKSGFRGCLSHTGLGFLPPAAIWGVNKGGSGNFMGSGFQFYPEIDVEAFVARFIKAFCAPSTAAGMSAETWHRSAGTLIKRRDVARVPSLISVGIAGQIQVKEQRPNRPTISIAAHMLKDKVLQGYLVTLTAHCSQTRLEQEMIGTLATINLLLYLTGLEQILIPAGMVSRIISDNNNLVKSGDGYIINPTVIATAFTRSEVVTEGGIFLSATGERLKITDFDPAIFARMAASIEPITPAHRQAALRFQEQTGKEVVFELSSTNADPAKGEISIEDLIKRSGQLWGSNGVLVQPCGAFLAKAEATERMMVALERPLATQDFAVGMDTAIRIIDPKYCAAYGGVTATLDRLLAANVVFHIMERSGQKSFDEFVAPYIGTRYRALFKHLQTGYERVECSSSMLRDAMEKRTLSAAA